jgi:hypothetical protein
MITSQEGSTGREMYHARVEKLVQEHTRTSHVLRIYKIKKHLNLYSLISGYEQLNHFSRLHLSGILRSQFSVCVVCVSLSHPPLGATPEAAERFPRTFVGTLRPHPILCNSLQAVTTWRTWEQQQRHLIPRGETKYGNRAWKSMQLRPDNFLVEYKLTAGQ